MEFKAPWIKHVLPTRRKIHLKSGCYIFDFENCTVEKIDELKELQNELKERKKKLDNLANEKISYRMYKNTEIYMQVGIEEVEEQIKKKQRFYKKASTIIDIEKARNVPMEDFLDIPRSGFIKCPWHKEKTPSMKYYPKTNTLHCFGECSRSYDVIDLVMLERGIDFISAVKLLN